VPKSGISGVKGLILDMDGVIVDSEPLHLLAFQELFTKHGIGYTAEHNREFLGRKDIVIADILIKRFLLPETAEEFVENKESILKRLIVEQGAARPGLMKILELAKSLGLPMAVASSATMPTIHLVVDTLKIRPYFVSLTSGDEVEHGKPAPDVFLLAAKRLGIEPKDCLVIEDTLNGIKAAKAAGMHCIGIPCEATMHQDHSLADMQLKSLDEVDLQTLCASRSMSN
jgi:HAD superfamily hydrolase (TIGR01509 family)